MGGRADWSFVLLQLLLLLLLVVFLLCQVQNWSRPAILMKAGSSQPGFLRAPRVRASPTGPGRGGGVCRTGKGLLGGAGAEVRGG